MRYVGGALLAALWVALAGSLPGQGGFHFVPTTATPTIQSALAAARDGDTVVVAAGTFFESINFLGKSVRVQGVGIGVSIIDGGGAASVVTMVSNEGPGAVLDGFTITNGWGDLARTPPGGLPDQYGGGVLVIGEVTPDNPSAAPDGPLVSNCEITGNIAARGAGVACLGPAHLVLEDCAVHTNTTIHRYVITTGHRIGGGVFLERGARLTMRRCSVIQNTADGCGGLALGGVAELEDSTISGNAALAIDSGGLRAENALLTRCVIHGNTAATYAGGLFQSSGTTRLVNCSLTGNVAGGAGAIYALLLPTLELVHCTVADNVSLSPQGAIMAAFDATITIDRSIVWNNQPIELETRLRGVITAKDSDVRGGLAGARNIDADPLFVLPAAGDYHLRVDSPCLDAVDPDGPAGEVDDLDGDPRPLFGAADMGADEIADVAADPCLAGNLGAGAGGPYDVLRVNGQAGGIRRRVRVAAGAPFGVLMLQPPTSVQPSRFVIFGQLGEPGYDDPVAVPAIGRMCFPPCPWRPLDETAFTLASSFAPGSCESLLPATPAVWSSPPIPTPLVPLDLTLQAIVEEAPGVLRVGNGVMVNVR